MDKKDVSKVLKSLFKIPEKTGTEHWKKNLTMTPQQGPKRTYSQGLFFHLEKHLPVSLM